ncbi:hypothetical protein Plhal703r1_c41g0141561 [Plasmopara halstedii]
MSNSLLKCSIDTCYGHQPRAKSFGNGSLICGGILSQPFGNEIYYILFVCMFGTQEFLNSKHILVDN